MLEVVASGKLKLRLESMRQGLLDFFLHSGEGVVISDP